MFRKVSVNTGGSGGSVFQSKSIEISAFGNGINIKGRSHIREVKHTSLQAVENAGVGEGTVSTFMLQQITETELVKN
jgi:hypothetical protein